MMDNDRKENLPLSTSEYIIELETNLAAANEIIYLLKVEMPIATRFLNQRQSIFSLQNKIKALKTTIKAIGELPRYRVEAVETWMSHICPAFKPTQHGDYVRYDELKKALLEQRKNHE